jgi:putative transposase
MTLPSSQRQAPSKTFPTGNDIDSLADRSEAERAEAFEHFKVIQPFLEDGVPLPSLAQQHGMSLRTVQRWLKQYQQGGLFALCRKPRSDRGTRRVLSLESVQLIEALALQKPRLSIAAISRKVAEIAKQQGSQAPAYDLVHDIVRQMDPALLTLVHEGNKVYSETFELLYRREAEAPNAIWQADHTLLDIVLKDDKGQAKKPWLTVIIDDYSRAVAGYMLSFDAPSALHTALILRQAIWGGRQRQAGRSAAYRASSTPITAVILFHSTLNKSVPT